MWSRPLLIIALAVVISFGFVLLFGAPYLPTMKKQVKAAIRLADLKPGQTILELGSGDGRVLIAAAQAGLNAVGYELNPLLFFYSWIRTRHYRKQIKVIFGNFWTKSWPRCDAIYVFLLPRLMNKLEKKIRSEGLAGATVISFAFKFSKLNPVAEAQ
jgi:SAM-dependent methyltransferase